METHLCVFSGASFGGGRGVPGGMQDLNSPTRDQTRAPCWGSTEP